MDLLDPATDCLVVTDAFGPAAHGLRGTSIGVGDRLTGWVAANRQVIVNSDAALDLGEAAATLSPPLQSCMSVPLTCGDSLVGVLSLYAAECNAFTDDHGRLLQMVAPHVAQAIARAKRSPAASAMPDVSENAFAAGARELRLVSSR